MSSLGISVDNQDEYLSYIKLGEEFVEGIQSMIADGKISKAVKVGRYIGNKVEEAK